MGCPEEGHLTVYSQNVFVKDRKFALTAAFLLRPQTSPGVSEQAQHHPPFPFPFLLPSQDTLSAQVFLEFSQPWGLQEKGGATVRVMLLPPSLSGIRPVAAHLWASVRPETLTKGLLSPSLHRSHM